MLKGGKLCHSCVNHTIQWDIWYKVFSSLETCVASGGAEAQDCSSQLAFWGWPPCWGLGYLSVILTSVYSVIWIKCFPYLYHCFPCLVFFCRKSEVWLQNLPFLLWGSALQCSCLARNEGYPDPSGSIGLLPTLSSCWTTWSSYCSCSGTSSSTSSQTCPTHKRVSFSIFNSSNCAVHSDWSPAHSNKQKCLIVKKPWAVVLLVGGVLYPWWLLWN